MRQSWFDLFMHRWTSFEEILKYKVNDISDILTKGEKIYINDEV